MKNKIDDGQMDFFGLLSEYTDDQGATVRVREPKRSIISRKSDDDYVQLTINLGKKAEPVKEEQGRVEPEKPESVKEEPKNAESEKEELLKEETLKEAPLKKEPKEVKPEKPESVKEEPYEKGASDVRKRLLFKDCVRCWCHDCKHNLYNEAVPRELAGRMIPCPACKTCEEDGGASLCEIGNAKEGCRLRALEEGIIIPETEEI